MWHVFAFLGIFFAHMLGHPSLDALASILIGVLLAGVAVLLGRESGALLVGERTNRSKIRRIRAIICADDSVDNVGDLLTMQLGPDQVLLNVDIRFNRGLEVQELESAIDRIERNIRRADPTIQPNLHGSGLPQKGVVTKAAGDGTIRVIQPHGSEQQLKDILYTPKH